MPFPDTRKGLEAMGYHYDGESHCRGCGELILWFETPKKKKIPMSIVEGTENEENRRLEAHWFICPHADDFRKAKGKRL